MSRLQACAAALAVLALSGCKKKQPPVVQNACGVSAASAPPRTQRATSLASLQDVAARCASSVDSFGVGTVNLSGAVAFADETVSFPVTCRLEITGDAQISFDRVIVTGSTLSIGNDYKGAAARITVALNHAQFSGSGFFAVELHDAGDRVLVDASTFDFAGGLWLTAAGSKQDSFGGGEVQVRGSSLKTMGQGTTGIRIIAGETAGGRARLTNNTLSTTGSTVLFAGDCAMDGPAGGTVSCNPNRPPLVEKAMPPAIDTYVLRANPTGNFGAAAALSVQQCFGAAALVRFEDVPLPAGTSLRSATLLLSASGADGVGPIEAHRMNRAWSETGATWECADAGGGKCAAADRWSLDGASAPYAASATATAIVADGAAVLDVTEDVRDFLMRAPNYGWLIKATGAGAGVQFGSRESGAAPRLVIAVDCQPGLWPDGTGGCNAGDACSGIVCLPRDSCHPAGVCDPSTGKCSNPAAPDGAACSDGNACAGSGTCKAGSCTGRAPLSCTSPGPCQTAFCDPRSGCGLTNLPDGVSCSDDNACNGAELCHKGACTAGTPLRCDDGNSCTADSCDGDKGCVHAPLPPGTACTSGAACAGTLACNSHGTCACSVTPANAVVNVSVVTNRGRPVPGAAVSSGGVSAIADQLGRVELTLPSGHTVVKVIAAGYAHSTAVLDLGGGASYGVLVSLLPLGVGFPFDATGDGFVDAGQVQVTVPANVLVDAAGALYAGVATAYVVPLDPMGDRVVAAPGPFAARALDGSVSDIQSIFMADVTFAAADGTRLQVAPAKTIGLRFRAPPALQAELVRTQPPPSTYPAYYYDEDAGRWVEEGSFTIEQVGAFYDVVAEVAHVTWWNCDHPWYEKNCYRVLVLDSHDHPVTGIEVQASGLDYSGTTTTFTDMDGIACANVKMRSTVTINIRSPIYAGVAGGPVTETEPYPNGSAAATCEGIGSGTCKRLTFHLVGNSCGSGRLVNSDGVTPVGGARVSAIAGTDYGAPALSTITAADGSFCLAVPQSSTVTLVAVDPVTQTVRLTQQISTSAAVEASCGDAGCQQLGTLQFSDHAKLTCVKGRLWNDGSPRTASAGQLVAVSLNGFNPSCPSGTSDPGDVDSWTNPAGRVIGRTRSGANGSYCVDFEVGAGADSNVFFPSILFGDCRKRGAQCPDRPDRLLTQAWISDGPMPIDDPERTCDLDNCVEEPDTDFGDFANYCSGS